MDNYNKELENNLLEMIRQKEQSDRRLLTMEIVMGTVCLIPLLAAVCLANMLSLKEGVQVLIILAGLLPLLIATPFALKIEQKAGYYVCKHCDHTYIPKYGNVFWAMHMGRTRYMRCPKCGKYSWQKKVISKD